ncbi:MAG: hypothetical protein WCT99_10905 [Bacteroidota bacterium]
MDWSNNILFVTVLSFLINFGCREKPTEPNKEEFIPSKSDYIWTVDTLLYHPGGQTLMQTLWGSSPTNVYAAGHDAQGYGTMWHYDGIEWKPVDLIPAFGGMIEGPFDLSIVYGFDSTNIYAAGSRLYQTFSDKPPYFLDSTFIIHFNGKTWNEEVINRKFGALSHVGALSASNIYFSGYGKYVYHFNNTVWNVDSVPFFYNNSNEYTINNNAVLVQNDAVPIIFSNVHNNLNGNDVYKFFKKTDSWVAIDSFTNLENPKWGYVTLWKDNEGSIYSGGDAVYTLHGDSWIQQFRPKYIIQKLWGTSKNNIFALSILGHVYHFNGMNWNELKIPSSENMDFHGIWGTEDEIFLSAYDGYRTFIFHGK